ncbi:MAG: hypothetical protein HY267_01825 [Deltaproteobacteria bacterium]|nr:hypothetical protein [Deltaproteobacteria bacterium]
MQNLFRSYATVTLSVLLSCASMAAAQVDGHGAAPAVETGPPQVIHRVNPHGMGLSIPNPGSTTPSSYPISFHGGPVMGGTPNVYLIWYGNWSQANGSDTPAGQQIVRDFVANVSGSPYFTINQSYDLPSPGVSGQVSFTPGTNEYTYTTYLFGNRLSDSNVQSLVTSAISSSLLPRDLNGVYFVLTSSDVNERSGFCTRYCGWHTTTSTSNGIRYSFVGNANRCLSSCAIQSVSPNGNAGVDGMISVLAHELEEMVTDPNLNAWYDSRGYENADKCAWTFGQVPGTQYQVANGAWANVHLPPNTTPPSGRDFEIQRNLYHNLNGPNGVGDYCMMDATHN